MTNQQTQIHGLSAIQQTFAAAKADGRATFMPYWMLGYPTLTDSIKMIQALIDAGADAIEIGIPFSDPLADGVVIQAAAQIALENGTTLTDCIGAIKTLRDGGATVPFLVMSYVNPLLAYGLDRYTDDAAAAGADGFIVPDLPPDEADDFLQTCDARGMALISFLAPTSNGERIALAAQKARGFIYLVSVTGITGARDALPTDLETYIKRVRSATDTPLVVGFGVSKPEQAQAIGQWADGVIVASALMRAFQREGAEAARKLAAELRAAC